MTAHGPARAGHPPPAAGEAPPPTGEPPPPTGEPAPPTGEPPPPNGEPPPRTGEPPPRAGEPPPRAGEPPPRTGEPPPRAGEPPPRTGEPAPRTGEPPPPNGEPPSTGAVEGWLTTAQAARLAACAARPRPAGAVVEIGSFRGRSTIVLARAAGAVVAIDPHAGGDRGPQEIAPEAARGEADFAAFHHNLAAAGVADRVRHVRLPSAQAHRAVDGPVSLLYVDGAHRFRPARADLVEWGGRVAPGGAMLVHDAFSSLGVTLALLTSCLRGWRYAGRSGSLAEYRRAPARPRDVVRQLAELPWLARNLTIKALILAGRRGWAERLGLDPSAPWPY